MSLNNSGVPDRIVFSFTGDGSLLRKLERARAVLWRKCPAGRLEDILAEVLDAFLDKRDPSCRLEKIRRLKRQSGRITASTETRRIPQWVKDEVWRRDNGQCVFKTPDGARCPERSGLEFDHRIPWALGGRSHDPGNIRLLCRVHNQIYARRMFGGSAEKARPP